MVGRRVGRPLFCLTAHGRSADRPPARHPFHHFTAFYDFSVTPEEIVDVWDYHLSRQRFLGDAFPTQWPNFGPGVAAGFLGAELLLDGRTVWFRPRQRQPLAELHFRFDAENPWLRRVSAIYAAAIRRWEGRVLLGMTDLGGALDLLSTFRPGTELLYDLYDDPEGVKRVAWELHECWWTYFEHFSAQLRPTNPGYSTWAAFYSEEPFYMLQCDFAYMLGPEMFDEFVKPELAASCRRLKNAFYHLDGPGQLPHLKSLLSIPELKGIQWVPGDGQPDVTEWPAVYRAIRDAGKLIQVFIGRRGLETVDRLAEQLGSLKGVLFLGGVSPADEERARALLRRYGAE